MQRRLSWLVPRLKELFRAGGKGGLVQHGGRGVVVGRFVVDEQAESETKAGGWCAGVGLVGFERGLQRDAVEVTVVVVVVVRLAVVVRVDNVGVLQCVDLVGRACGLLLELPQMHACNDRKDNCQSDAEFEGRVQESHSS